MNYKEIEENQVNNKTPRDIYDQRTLWEQRNHEAKQYKSADLWIIKEAKNDNIYFLVSGKYKAYLSAIVDKDVIFIYSAFSYERGAYKELMDLILKTPINEIVSDVVLSEDATKFWMKIINDKTITKTFRNFKDEVVLESKKLTDEDIKKYFLSSDYRVGIK